MRQAKLPNEPRISRRRAVHVGGLGAAAVLGGAANRAAAQGATPAAG